MAMGTYLHLNMFVYSYMYFLGLDYDETVTQDIRCRYSSVGMHCVYTLARTELYPFR